MSPEDLARHHPRLFHVTQPECVEGILAGGLLSTSRLLDRFGINGARRAVLEAAPRPTRVVLRHPRHGQAVLNDNTPLSEKALAGCLDDGLSPADWLGMLNQRVFFWADEDEVATLTGARLNRGRNLAVLVLDTLGLVRAHASRVELCPINSGSTIRKPARRGLATFTKLGAHDYQAWRGLRGQRDRVREVVVRDGVSPVAGHVIAVRHITGG